MLGADSRSPHSGLYSCTRAACQLGNLKLRHSTPARPPPWEVSGMSGRAGPAPPSRPALRHQQRTNPRPSERWRCPLSLRPPAPCGRRVVRHMLGRTQVARDRAVRPPVRLLRVRHEAAAGEAAVPRVPRVGHDGDAGVLVGVVTTCTALRSARLYV